MTTTLAQRVVAGLKDKILAADLPPGSNTPSEAELIEEYRVSRTVVREAVTRLEVEAAAMRVQLGNGHRPPEAISSIERVTTTGRATASCCRIANPG
jgi:DNA-binding FadR family transcriptional regulator